MSTRIVTHGGRRFTEDMLAAVLEVARLCQQGKAGFTPRITQGGHNSGAVSASAGTHDGDAVDWSVSGLTHAQVSALVENARKVGIAAWFRTANAAKWGTRAQGFGSYHVHGVPNRWGLPSRGAISQATAYRNGRDGLARNLADLGPGHTSAYRTRTWAEYKRLAQITPPNTGATGPTSPTGGLTMSEAAAINQRLDEIAEAVHRVGERNSANTQTLADLQQRRASEVVQAVLAGQAAHRQELQKIRAELITAGLTEADVDHIVTRTEQAAEKGATEAIRQVPVTRVQVVEG